MFSADLPSETKQLLQDITPNFEENLKRAFKNEGIRLQAKRPSGSSPNFIHSLDDVLLTANDTKIELRNLKFPWIPDFRINNMSVDLQKSCLNVDLNLGTLRVDGQYEVNNSTLRKILPVSHVGRIGIVFNNVRTHGKIGLVIKHDSLVPQNYDLNHELTGVSVRVAYHVDATGLIENEITSSNVENTIGLTVWNELTQTITNLLHRQLSEVVVEFSLTELLMDKDEEFREYAREQSLRANRLLDSLLCTAKDRILSENWRSVSTPPFDVVYKETLGHQGKTSRRVQQGTLATARGGGYIQDLASLTRHHNFSLYEDKHVLSVYGCVSLREFKHGYTEYHSEYDGIKIDGSIKASVYKNEIFLKITLKKEGERCTPQLDSVRVRTVKDIDIDASGLASLSWLYPHIKSWVIGNLRACALPVLEKYIREAFVQAISKTDCIALLTD